MHLFGLHKVKQCKFQKKILDGKRIDLKMTVLNIEAYLYKIEDQARFEHGLRSNSSAVISRFRECLSCSFKEKARASLQEFALVLSVTSKVT